MILARLSALVAQDGGLLADALHPEDAIAAHAAPHGEAVARGPRAEGHPADLPLVVEAVREGYLLHYGGADGAGSGRIISRDDEDLALLAGDRLYALGLERLARAGDLDAVRALTDLIALSAQAQAAADDELAGAVWAAGCEEVGWGPSRELAAAKEAARAGDSDAAQKLRDAAVHVAAALAAPR